MALVAPNENPVQRASLIGTLLLAVETKPLNRLFIPVSKKHTMFPVVFAVARLNVSVSGASTRISLPDA